MPDFYKFDGTHYEIGQQIGEVYKENGMSIKPVAAADRQILEKQKQIYKQYFPEILDEIRGTADALECDLDGLIHNYLCGEIEERLRRQKMYDELPAKSCAAFGYNNGKSNKIMARNYDWSPYTHDVFMIYRNDYPSSRYNSFFGITGTYFYKKPIKKQVMFCPEDIINSKGLYIGILAGHCKFWTYGLTFSHYIRKVAETCETVADVVQLVKDLPSCGPKNFFVFDKDGNSCVIEHIAKDYRVVYPDHDGLLTKTNHYKSPDFISIDGDRLFNVADESIIREHEMRRFIYKYINRKQTIDTNAALKIMRNPDTYLYDVKETIWTLVIDVTNQKYTLVYKVHGDEKKTKKINLNKYV